MSGVSYEAQGEITSIGETNQVSERYKVREFIIQVEWGDWPNYMKFQFTQAGTSKLNNYEIGDNVIVTFNIKGSMSKNGDGRCFVNLNAWKIDTVGKPSQKEHDSIIDEDTIPF